VETREVRLDDLDFGAVCAVARRGARVGVSPEARERVRAFREHVECIEGGGDRAVYGVTTGFGALATVRIPPQERRELQHARREVPFVERDRFLASHLASAEEMVRSGALVEAAEEFVELR